MKEKKEKIVFMPDNRERVMIKDGKKFRLKKETIGKDGHIKRVIYEEFDEKEYNKKVKEVVDYLIEKTGLTAKDVLTHIINTGSMRNLGNLDKLHKDIFEEKIEPELKEGCLSIKIGKQVIEEDLAIFIIEVICLSLNVFLYLIKIVPNFLFQTVWLTVVIFAIIDCINYQNHKKRCMGFYE